MSLTRRDFIKASTALGAALGLPATVLAQSPILPQPIPPDELPPVSADQELLKEVLVNLMVNACDAMPSGGRLTIHEETVRDSALGAAVRVRLADTGPGIPAHQREEVFKPFFSTKENGTGLGLPIASRIIEEHGGRLELDPTASMGAAFVMALPAGDRERAANHPAAQGEKP